MEQLCHISIVSEQIGFNWGFNIVNITTTMSTFSKIQFLIDWLIE